MFIDDDVHDNSSIFGSYLNMIANIQFFFTDNDFNYF